MRFETLICLVILINACSQTDIQRVEDSQETLVYEQANLEGIQPHLISNKQSVTMLLKM